MTDTYPYQKFGFYNLPSQKALATLLGLPTKRLKRITRDREKYYWFKQQVINGKIRDISVPYGDLRKIHERLKNLFDRIELPDYLHAPRRGFSFLSNAVAHNGNKVIAKLDIRKFYPSTTDEHLFRFLYYKLKMKGDVAGLLTKLCTIHGRMPFGSPLSPILCFHIHRNLFDKIEKICVERRLILTLYVDDITISGAEVSGKILFEVKKLIHQAHLRYHKVRKLSKSREPVITGVRLTQKGPAPSKMKHRGLQDKLRILDRTLEQAERERVIRSLIGSNQHLLQVYDPGHPAHGRAHRRGVWLQNERRRLGRTTVASASRNGVKVSSEGADAPPF